MTTPPSPGACLWCGRTFTPPSTAGHTQRYCRQTCRRSFDAAGRRWVAEALACGLLSIEALRTGAAATRALLLGGFLHGVDREDEK
jgi:hypothetical protein